MFNKNLIPQPNAQMKQHLANLYNQVGANAQHKNAIDKRMEKIDDSLKQKIENTFTVSEYFDNLWKQTELKEKHKEFVIKKLEAVKKINSNKIKQGDQSLSKESANLDIYNDKFKMTPFEEFNYNEKLKHIKKKAKLDMQSDLFDNHSRELDILNAVNRPTRLSLSAPRLDFLHYTAGLCEVDETDAVKQMKAHGFVKKIHEEKKAFKKKIKQMEKSSEQRELEELEIYKKKEQQEEEQRQKERKKQLEAHIKELKARSEVRLKEGAKWEEDYKIYLDKRPMFKEIERNYKKGYVIPELEERKKKLQEIRDFHKPIPLQELRDHEQKIMKALEEHQQEKKQQLENPGWTYKKPEYESKHHKTFAEELARARRQKEESQMDLNKRKEKVMELLQDVKDNRLPKVDPQKEMELMSLVEKLKSKSNRKFKSDGDEPIDPKQLGDEYLKSVKEMAQKIKRENVTRPKELDFVSAGKKSEGNIKDIKLGPQTAKSETVMKKPNYLADLRKQNIIPSQSNQVDLIIKNKKLDQKEKKELLQSEIEKLEEKAKRKETLKKLKIKKNAENGGNNDDEDVDEIYINAIKAKLQMLAS